MVPIKKDGSRLSGFPVSRGQGVEVVAGRHCREPGEDVAQVNEGIYATALAGYHDRVDDRRSLAGVRVTDKEPVFLLYGRWPDGCSVSD